MEDYKHFTLANASKYGVVSDNGDVHVAINDDDWRGGAFVLDLGREGMANLIVSGRGSATAILQNGFRGHPCNVYRSGNGNGDAIRVDGTGDAVREGFGEGDAIKRGFGHGDARHTSDGKGMAINDSIHPGDATSDSKNGGAIRRGDGYGHAIKYNARESTGDARREGDGNGIAWVQGYGTGDAIRNGCGIGDAVVGPDVKGSARKATCGEGRSYRQKDREEGVNFPPEHLPKSNRVLQPGEPTLSQAAEQVAAYMIGKAEKPKWAAHLNLKTSSARPKIETEFKKSEADENAEKPDSNNWKSMYMGEDGKPKVAID